MSAQPSQEGNLPGPCQPKIVIAGKLVVARNGEVGIRGLVVFGLRFQIRDALVVVHLLETFHTLLTIPFHENPARNTYSLARWCYPTLLAY
jgi:hypothetical protein